MPHSRMNPVGRRMRFLVGVAAMTMGCGRIHFDGQRDAADADAADADAPALPVLAVVVRTGATADLTAIVAARASSGAGSLASVDPLAYETVRAVLGDDAIAWTQSFSSLAINESWHHSTWNQYWASVPTDLDVVTAIGRNGEIAAVVIPRGPPEHALAALTWGGVTSEETATFGAPIAAGASLTHRYLGLGARSTMPASIVFRVYLDEAAAGRMVGGTPVLCSSYGCNWGRVSPGFDTLPFALYNGLGQPISVYLSALYASQPQTMWSCGCPFDGMTFGTSPWGRLFAALNAAWNPLPDPMASGAASRSFTTTTSSTMPAYVTAVLDGDNTDSGVVTFDGLAVAQFANNPPDAQMFHSTQIPTQLTLSLNNTFSSTNVELRIAVLGEQLSFSNVSETPSAANPAPLEVVLPTGWN